MAQDKESAIFDGDAAPQPREISSLNLDALDVEELERRLEMAAGAMTSAAWICGTNDNHPPPPPTCTADGGGGCPNLAIVVVDETVA